MKYQLIVLLALGCTVTSKDYDDDEGRPYEFGFTIDGQQHRRESKDINGIIMGEFGFITADGVYHVTVYATDENGAFKILSMRNIKVSEPLDTPGYKFPSKVPSGNPRPIKEISTTIRTTISTTTTTTPKAPYRFTTVPSLNVPACSSCALPSTTPSPPGAPPNNKLPFQTPAFQPGYKPGTKPDVQNNGIFNAPGVQNQFDKPLGQVPVGPVQKPNVDPPFGQVPAYNDLPNLPKPADIQRPPYNSQNVVPPIQNVIPPLQNVIPPHKPVRTPADEPPKVTVANGMIQIPGKVPIPIKDKYPNMQEGLPAGITKDDMLDLLYKFNYTLGFHGHHEKGLKDGTKIGGYFVNGRDGISRVVEYIADKNGYRPKVKFINLGLDSPLTPREGTEKTFGLQGFEFVWYPI